MIRKIAVAAAFVLFGTASQADDINQFFFVGIDGYCTTLGVHIQGELVSGYRNNSTCATNAPVSVTEGGVVATVDGVTGVVMSETDGGKVFTWLFEQPVDGAGAVYVVASDGKSSRRSAKGTYHILRKSRGTDEKRNGPDFMDQVREMNQVGK